MDRLLAMQVFERVANESGFAAAARSLDMSPPVVTRLVAELEGHLGTRLFQRTTRKVSLTDAGVAYLACVRQILQDVDEADALAIAHTNRLAGRLRLHTLPVLASYVVAPLLPEFRRRHPGIVIELEVESYRDPSIEDFDITLLGTDASFDANIVARRIVESDVILVASPEYVERKGAPQRPEDLVQHDCLRLKRPDGSLRAWRMWRCQSPDQVVERDVEAVLVANHTDTLLRAAIDGAGITSIALDIAAPYLTRGDLVRVLSPWVTGRLAMYAAVPSRKFIPQRSRVFLDYLVEQIREQHDKALHACTAC
ncbi:LysR family transcriptional regulator [Pollutimonas harenae]|uniref:LysR family transcriptional regulator n=1 Tax=Pollutimonas harenae TaxID=657015 RepID=A0A853H5E3_9BURK|nr:LysR family transcriptional regulator [Pollutimonas harenae]NYT86395.1 LysR family transcriptional regulator [Pollutimonas harenae]TEA69851.1 LysR family transcriptional regulator [Pollutimonas harenae]